MTFDSLAPPWKIPSSNPPLFCSGLAGHSIPLTDTGCPATSYNMDLRYWFFLRCGAVDASWFTRCLPTPQHLFRADTMPAKAGSTLNHLRSPCILPVSAGHFHVPATVWKERTPESCAVPISKGQPSIPTSKTFWSLFQQRASLLHRPKT